MMFSIEFDVPGLPMRARIPASSLGGTYADCPSNATVRDTIQPGWRLAREGWQPSVDGSLFWNIEADSD